MWIPQHKYQLVTWLANYYHKSRYHFKSMAKPQLYAIYFNTRKGVN